MGQWMAKQASGRQPSFASWQELAAAYQRPKAFARVRPGVPDLLARTTLRPAPDGAGLELICPPACEARVLKRMYDWAIVTHLETLCGVRSRASAATRLRCSPSCRPWTWS